MSSTLPASQNVGWAEAASAVQAVAPRVWPAPGRCLTITVLEPAGLMRGGTQDARERRVRTYWKGRTPMGPLSLSEAEVIEQRVIISKLAAGEAGGRVTGMRCRPRSPEKRTTAAADASRNPMPQATPTVETQPQSHGATSLATRRHHTDAGYQSPRRLSSEAVEKARAPSRRHAHTPSSCRVSRR